MSLKLTANDFVRLLKIGDIAAIKGRTVTGAVVMNGAHIQKPIALDEVDFEGETDFSDCIFEHSLLFIGCTFRQGISLGYVEIHGGLLFDSVRMAGWSLQFIKSALRLEQAEIAGNLEVRRSSINESIDLSGAKIKGSIDFVGTEVRGDINLGSSKVSLDVSFTPLPPAQLRAPIRTEISGSIYFDGATIEGPILFVGVTVGGDIDLQGSKVHSVHSYSALGFLTEIRGDLMMSAAVASGYINFVGTVIGGKVIAYALKCDRMTFGFDDKSGHSCRTGGIFGMAMVVNGWLSLNRIQVTGSAVERGQRGIWIEDSKINGHLFALVTPDEQDLGDPVSAGKRGALVLGSFVARNCEISGDCILTNLNITGKISLENSRIQGNILFGSMRPTVSTSNKPREYQARADCLDLSNVTCGSVDLTGLNLWTRYGREPVDPQFKSIVAPNLTCRGNLLLFSSVDRYARIQGGADFARAAASKFVVSGRSFYPEDERNKGEDPPLKNAPPMFIGLFWRVRNLERWKFRKEWRSGQSL